MNVVFPGILADVALTVDQLRWALILASVVGLLVAIDRLADRTSRRRTSTGRSLVDAFLNRLALPSLKLEPAVIRQQQASTRERHRRGQSIDVDSSTPSRAPPTILRTQAFARRCAQSKRDAST